MSVPTGEQNVQNWLISMIQLYQRKKECGKFEFDKDDISSMRFISATTNLRALMYGINQKSSWDIKKIAGNIIPGQRKNYEIFSCKTVSSIMNSNIVPTKEIFNAYCLIKISKCKKIINFSK